MVYYRPFQRPHAESTGVRLIFNISLWMFYLPIALYSFMFSPIPASCRANNHSKYCCSIKGKVKAVPLQAWRGPEGSRKLRSSDFMTTAQDGGKVVSLTHQLPLLPGNTTGTHFCYRLSRPQGHSATGSIMSLKYSSDTIGNRTRDLTVCSVVP
jgi:hypothetical protein